MNRLRFLKEACTTAALLLAAFATSLQAQSCIPFKASGPVTVTRNNQIIQNLVITAPSGPGIDLNGHSFVTISNVVIYHAGGPGIAVHGATNVTITNADILFTAAPPSGANSSTDFNNIDCYDAPNLTVRNVRLTRGSSGIYLDRCPGSRLSFIEGHDQRGPYPRGQLVQWDNSNNGELQDFSNETSLTRSWPEDNVNVYQSTNMVIRRGLLDGNNAPTGDGVLIDEKSGNVLVQDVDAIRQGNGCFGVYGAGAHDVTFRNTRCRDTVCVSTRGIPSSNGLGWAIDPNSVSGNLKIINAAYANLCNPTNIVWDEKMLAVSQITERNFIARKPLRVALCQYAR